MHVCVVCAVHAYAYRNVPACRHVLNVGVCTMWVHVCVWWDACKHWTI